MTPRLGLYLAATLLVCLSPGPNVLLMISLGLRHGARAALEGVAGVAAASAVFLLVAVLGLVALVTASATVFAWVRYAGAAYLVYIGMRLIVAALRRTVAVGIVKLQPGGAFWQAFLTHISNPKAVLFWSALLPQFVEHGRPIAPQILTLGLTALAIDAVILAGYGLLAAITRRSTFAAGARRWIDGFAGVFLTLTGLLLALASR